TLGAGLGAIAAGIGAGVAAGFAGLAWPIIGAASIAACGVGFVATPFLVMGALAFGGATVGLLGTPLGFVKGCMKAQRHRELLKPQGAVVQATPALQTAAPDAQETATRIFSQLRDLPAELQAPVLKSLSESFAATGNGAAESIMKSIDALPDADRK